MLKFCFFLSTLNHISHLVTIAMNRHLGILHSLNNYIINTIRKKDLIYRISFTRVSPIYLHMNLDGY